MAVSLRDAVDDDRAFLLSTCRETLLKNSAYCAGLHPATMSVLLDPILATYRCVVAVDENSPDTIVGFIVYQDAWTIAFIYVRSQFRRGSNANPRGGIAKALLKHAGLDLDAHREWFAAEKRRAEARDERPELREVFCALLVTSMAKQNFLRLAERIGLRLRFRPFAALEIMSNLHFERKAAKG